MYEIQMSLRFQRTILVLGFSGVGKTCLCWKYTEHQFREEHEPTYEGTYRRNLRYRNKVIELKIVDTQAFDEQEIFRNEYCLGSHGYVLVFALNSRKSFEMLKRLNAKLIKLMGNVEVPRVIVGNKSDCERNVLESEARQFAREANSFYFECSVKYDDVGFIFRVLLGEIDKADNLLDTSCCDSCSICWPEIADIPTDYPIPLSNPVSPLNPTALYFKLPASPILQPDYSEERQILFYRILLVCFILNASQGCVAILISIVIAANDSHVITLFILAIFGFTNCALSVFGIFALRNSNKFMLKIVFIFFLIVHIQQFALSIVIFALEIASTFTFESLLWYNGILLLILCFSSATIQVLMLSFALTYLQFLP